MVRLSSAMWWGVGLGIVLGLGLWVLSSLIPRLGAPDLASRVAPYVRDISAEARKASARGPADPGPLVGVLVVPLALGARRVVSRALGGDDGVVRKLRQAGSPTSADRLRSHQLLAGAVGLFVGIVIAIGIARSASTSPLLGVAAAVVLALAGVVAPEQLLARRARARIARMSDELPTLLEFLTLSLAAGESALDAFRRIARTGTGELSTELAAVVASGNAGRPLATALSDSARELAMPAWTRCVDQIVTALDRGTPLVDVLRAQAQDARDHASRQLLESAGKKEVAMLVPLVFLILPITVLFAVFPGILVLQLGF